MKPGALVSPIANKPLLFLICLLLMCVPGWTYCLTVYQDYPALRMTGWLAFITALPALIAWTVCKLANALLTALTAVVLLVLFAVNLFLILHFQSMISPWILLLCHETNRSEASEFIGRYATALPSIIAYSLTLLAAAMTIAACLSAKRRTPPSRRKPADAGIARWLADAGVALWLAVGCLQVGFLFSMVHQKNLNEFQQWYEGKAFYSLQNTCSNLLYSAYHLYLTSQENQIALNSAIKASQTPATCRATSDSLDVVLIIGESFNKHHASVYGYPLPTTPWMQHEQQLGNLDVFTDVVTPYNMTTLAVKNMLSTNSISRGEYWTDYPPVTILFRQAGFDVAIWDNQKAVGEVTFHDFSISSFLYSRQMQQMAYHHVNDTIYDYDHQLVAHTIHTERNSPHTFTIYHLMGQHSQARYRYPHTPANQVFSPSEYGHRRLTDEQRQSIADYDNATRYNDHVVEQIVTNYNRRCAVVVYLSDHGEEVYDYREFIGRSHEPQKDKQALRYQYETPLVVWCSDTYRRRFPALAAAIRNATRRPLMTDNLPQLLIALGMIETPYYIARKDILSDDYQCGRRIVQESTDYDIVSSAPASAE